MGTDHLGNHGRGGQASQSEPVLFCCRATGVLAQSELQMLEQIRHLSPVSPWWRPESLAGIVRSVSWHKAAGRGR